VAQPDKRHANLTVLEWKYRHSATESIMVHKRERERDRCILIATKVANSTMLTQMVNYPRK